jgi:hypothetical protein
MYCPTCGSEERQLSQYCRACGTDLRVVRIGLERPDSITASAVSARDRISTAIAEKIRETTSARDLHRVAEDVLPEIAKFLESPEEKRLRRTRSGVVVASMGLGAAIIFFLLTLAQEAFMPLVGLGTVVLFIGLGIIVNGLVFTVPRKELPDHSKERQSQGVLDSQTKHLDDSLRPTLTETSTNELNPAGPATAMPSVTEHTTHQLKKSR